MKTNHFSQHQQVLAHFNTNEKPTIRKSNYNYMRECIIELGYIPPTEEYQLFQKGGYRYREGLESFNECSKV